MRSVRILHARQRAAVALAGLAIVTNALTWLNIALTPVAFFCFLLVFPLFAGGLLSLLNKMSPRPMEKAWAAVRGQALGREMWSQILAGLSRSQLVAAYVFVAYVFINFFGTFAVMSGRHDELMDPALQVRLMTGHAAIFLLVAAGLFRATRRL